MATDYGLMHNTEHHEEQPTMNYRKFIDTLYCLLLKVWGEGSFTMTMKRPNFYEDVKNADMPVITYVLTELKPGQVGQSGNVERKPRPRNHYEYIDEDGVKQFVRREGQILDAVIEFTVYAQNNAEALELSENFRALMNTYKGYFRKNGLDNIWFQREYERQGNEQRRDDMSTRGMDYLVRFEEITEMNPNAINSILLDVDTLYNRMLAEGKLPSQSTN